MATETLYPTAIEAISGLTGAVTSIDEDPSSPDSNWVTNTASNGSIRVSFATPTGSLTTGSGLQTIRVYVRKNASGGGDPTMDAYIYENGSLVGQYITGQAVTSATGALYSFTWDASSLGNTDGSGVEVQLDGTKGGGGPNERRLEIGAIAWDVTYNAAQTISTTSADISVPVTTVSGSGVVNITIDGSGSISVPITTVSGSGYRAILSSGDVGISLTTVFGSGGNGELITLRPNADTSVGNWTTNSGATTGLYTTIDEITPNDSDYIRSEQAPSASIVKISLGNPTNTVVPELPHVVKYRYRKELAGNTINLTVRLVEGASTTIASWTHNNISNTVVEAEQTLTGPQVSSITNYSSLHLEFEATQV